MIEFPDDRRFAFTILDDTDDATTENLGPIYKLLHEIGMRTTKTVWAVDCPPELQGPFFAGATLQDAEYLAFVKELVQEGFELAFHNATMGSSPRQRTIDALDVLRTEFGELPTVHCNHGLNRENLYWGINRYRTPGLRGSTRSLAVERGEIRGRRSPIAVLLALAHVFDRLRPRLT